MATRSPARKSRSIVKDDTGAADVTKRLAEELIGNDHASVLMGFGLTPLALAAAPVATEAKVPEIVTAAATAMITEKSPYIVRTSFTLPQASAPMAEWCAEERDQEGRHDRRRLRSRRRRREMVRRHIREGRRDGHGKDPRAVEEPGLRALPAAREGRRARRGVRLRAFGSGRGLHEGVRRARPRQVRDQADRHRRRDRRRPSRRHRRFRARRSDHASLFGRPRFAREQGLRRRVREGQQRHAAEFHGGRRL